MKVTKLAFNYAIGSKSEKKGIVIHGTGGSTVEGAVNTFTKSGVSVPFIIDRAGNIYQLYDEGLLHWHAGKDFRDISRKTIGIELVNWNHLNFAGGHYTTWTDKLIPKEEVILAGGNWRGHTCFHKPTKEQHKALCELLKHLCEKHSIKKELTRGYNPAKILDPNWSGICFHSSFHPEKTDFYPLVIDKIQI